MKKVSGLLAFLMCLAPVARAQIKASHFPRDAQWVLHVDLKALNEAPMGRFLKQSLDEQARRGMASIKAASGIDLTNDVDSLVVCGKGGAEAGGVMYAYGRFNIPKLTAIAGGAKEFRNTSFGERNLLSWSDKGKRTNLCFIDPTLVVMSQDERLVRDAVSLIDGKVKGMQAGQSFAKMLAHRKGRFLAVQANNLSALAGTNQQLQLFKQAEALLLEVGQLSGANGVDCALTLKAANPESAQQMNQAATGLQALFMLQAAQKPDVAELAQNLKIGMQETYVTLSLRLPEALLQKLIQTRLAQPGNGTATAGAGQKPARPAF